MQKSNQRNQICNWKVNKIPSYFKLGSFYFYMFFYYIEIIKWFWIIIPIYGYHNVMHNTCFLFCILDHALISWIITKETKFYSVKNIFIYKIIHINLLIIRSVTIPKMHELCEIRAYAIYICRFKVATLNFLFCRIVKRIKIGKPRHLLCMYVLDLLQSHFFEDDTYNRIWSAWILTKNFIALFLNGIAICYPLNAMQNAVMISQTSASIHFNRVSWRINVPFLVIYNLLFSICVIF